MARPIPDLDPMTAAEVASDDNIIIDDTSAGETKRIPVGALLGLPSVGWTAAGEVWSFVSWNSTTKIGVIQAPTDATTKYAIGNYVRFSQPTGGIKYGKILSLTSTQLTLWMPSHTLTNETITVPNYSPLATPIGAPITLTDGEPYMFSAYETAGASYVTAANINFNTENYDPTSIITSGVFTAPVAGRYHFDVGITLQTASGGSVWINLSKNGVAHMRGGRLDSVPGPIYNPTMSIDLQLAAGDTIAFGIAFTQGGSKPLESGWNYFTGHKLSRV